MNSSPEVSHYLHVKVIKDSNKSRHLKYNLNENGIVIVSSNTFWKKYMQPMNLLYFWNDFITMWPKTFLYMDN